LEELALDERALEERAPQGQQAHSPGQSVAAPRDSYSIAYIRPERAKVLVIRQLQFLCPYVFMLLPLQGAGIGDV